MFVRQTFKVSSRENFSIQSVSFKNCEIKFRGYTRIFYGKLQKLWRIVPQGVHEYSI